MATSYEIPLSGSPETFSIQLDGTTYQISTQYADATEAGWFINIATDDGTPIISGLPLVTGLDLLEPYVYLGIAGSLYVYTDVDTDAVPTYSNLGSTSHLVYVV
ncbi:phage baseplate plug family protein [Allorhizobium ampelinum]|uniref:phage baseplate plug family protein n=1 Tax=Allorhizobium ampelinum TaxID=3025782 RepID=UPI000B4048FD|nr:hypothetical protein [Allorhizobium ampelinum]NTA27392.1 hypothetical protein [Allorhizobium ampelinum]OVE94447.1 hypothetical protein B7W85_12920 [Allorhizobium ampelinum]